ILQSAGYIEYETDPDARARLKFLLGRDELYKLYETTPNEEAVISALLRNYSGLFSDYRYVEEALISQVSGLSQNEVYLILKSLSHRRILHFIPQRKTPFITYTQDRIDGCDVVIPASVYDQRKEQFIKHVNAIEAYATNNHVCRSRQLLRYFDETKSEDCGICDVCVDHQPNPNAEQEFKDAKQAILDLLADHKPHDIKETSELLLPRKAFKEALKYLCNEELVHIDGLLIYR
ncbi:RecQ family zinc-binding domain-containing protein, partial [Hallella sp.]